MATVSFASLASTLVISFIGLASAQATTYYVSGSGSDSYNGRSTSAAFRSLQRAADLVVPGDTVYVMNGTYSGAYNGADGLTITRSGAPGKYITFKAYSGHRPKINFSGWNGIRIAGASYIAIEGIEVEGNVQKITAARAQSLAQSLSTPENNHNCIGVVDSDGKPSHHIRIAKSKLHDCACGGISVERSDYMLIEDNQVYRNALWSPYGCSGISLYSMKNIDSGTGIKNVIRRNRTFENENRIGAALFGGGITDGNGIIIDDSKHTQSDFVAYVGRTLVENNISYKNGGAGIHLFQSAYVDVVNNTTYQNNQTPSLNHGEIDAVGCYDVRILNNIMYAKSGKALNNTFGSTLTAYNYNIYYNGTPSAKGQYDMVTDPKLMSPANGDFRLTSTSPAINSASTTLMPGAAIDGTLRPQGGKPDRGAYEYKP